MRTILSVGTRIWNVRSGFIAVISEVTTKEATSIFTGETEVLPYYQITYTGEMFGSRSRNSWKDITVGYYAEELGDHFSEVGNRG